MIVYTNHGEKEEKQCHGLETFMNRHDVSSSTPGRHTNSTLLPPPGLLLLLASAPTWLHVGRRTGALIGWQTLIKVTSKGVSTEPANMEQ